MPVGLHQGFALDPKGGYHSAFPKTPCWDWSPKKISGCVTESSWNSKLKVTSATKQYFLKICHLKHRLRIFLFRRKIMFRSQDIQVFVFLTISWFTKSVTSGWVLVHETRCISEYIFWTTTHEDTELGQMIDISKGDNFQ